MNGLKLTTNIYNNEFHKILY